MKDGREDWTTNKDEADKIDPHVSLALLHAFHANDPEGYYNHERAD
jgi:hypothetical protein